MSDGMWRHVAGQAGLGVALKDYPDDVKAAAESAAAAAAGIEPVTDPAAEPWPPMRTAASA